jgi:hypothetical protein
MATLTVQSGNSIGVGPRVSLITTADTYIEIAGVFVISTNAADAIFSNVASATDILQISGQVIGANAINFTAASSTLYLTNEASGYIDGTSGYGLNSSGYNIITNYGVLTGSSGGANLAGGGAIYNYGTISSRSLSG